MRRVDLENRLCDAIRTRHIVTLRYDKDVAQRSFAPHAVYHSGNDKVLVSGLQLENPADYRDRLVPRNFEVALIQSLTVTSSTFTPDPKFNRRSAKYDHGIICSV